MNTYRITALPGTEADAQAKEWDGHHAPGGYTIYAFARCPAFVGIVAQEYREMMGERKRGGIAGAGAAALVLLLGILAHLPFILTLAFAGVAAFAAYRVVGQLDPFASEVASHALTVRASILYDGLTNDDAELRAARSLTTYKGFAGQQPDALIALMRQHYAEADQWLAANVALCRGWVALKQAPVWGAS